MTDVVEPCFDTSLADLEKAISVGAYDRETGQITVSMNLNMLNSILTAASLYEHHEVVRVEPIEPDETMADVVRANNKDNQRYHWLRRDSIDFLQGLLQGGANNDKRRGIVHNREYRKWLPDQTKADIEAQKGELREWLYGHNATPLDGSELRDLLTKVRALPMPIMDWSVTVRLLITALEAMAARDKAKEAVQKAIGFLNGRNL